MKRLALATALVALAACGSSDDGASVTDAWARTSAAGQTTGAVYFELSVDADDRLLGASVPTAVAADAQIHQVTSAASTDDESMDDMDDESMDDMDDELVDDMDDESMDDMDDESMDDMDDESMDDMDDGHDMSAMQEMTDGLALTAGETVTFAPGGYHVMLVDLVAPLATGDEIELTLDFELADDVTLTVPVAETAP